MEARAARAIGTAGSAAHGVDGDGGADCSHSTVVTLARGAVVDFGELIVCERARVK